MRLDRGESAEAPAAGASHVDHLVSLQWADGRFEGEMSWCTAIKAYFPTWALLRLESLRPTVGTA